MSSYVHTARGAFASQKPDMKALVDAVDVVTAESPAPAVAYLAPSPPTAVAPSASVTATAGPFRKRKHGDPLAAALDASSGSTNSYAGHLSSVPSPFHLGNGMPAYPVLPPMNAAMNAPVAVTSAASSAGGKAKKPRTAKSAKTTGAKATAAGRAPDAAVVNPARQKRLEQNRLAAIESRRRKKVVLEELQRSVAFYTKANATLKSQNEDLEGRILWAKCKAYQMEQEKQKQANGENLEAGDDENKSGPEGNAKLESHTTAETGASSEIIVSEKVAKSTEVLDPAASSKPPVLVRVPAQLPFKPAANTVPASHVSRPVKTAAFSKVPMAKDGTEVELTEEQQAHFAATQALYKSMGFPPGAARAAAFTFCLTGRSGCSAFGGSDDPEAARKMKPTASLNKQVAAVIESKKVKSDTPSQSVRPVPAPVSVPALPAIPAIAAASTTEKKTEEVAATASCASTPVMRGVPMQTKDSNKNEDDGEVDTKEKETDEDADASNSYIEALNKFAMQQAVAANAAAAAASAAIQAAKFHSELMKKKHQHGGKKSTIHDYPALVSSPDKSPSPSASTANEESRNSQSTSSPTPSSPSQTPQGMHSMQCFSFPFQGFGTGTQMPFPQMPNNMIAFSAGSPWRFPSMGGYGSEEKKE
mmetsp:Transcript_28219/g.58017  ORF Transcript_28219/g.58017 Transcript_28219/m.58017 type:complete len:646 (-) Transcript_28219:244-2181(-)